jgi:alpha-mannosidase
VAIGPGGHSVTQGDLQISLVRSAIYCHCFLNRLRTETSHDFMDLGENRFQFALLAGSASRIQPQLVRLAERMTLPASAAVHFPLGASRQAGIIPETNLIEVIGQGVELGAVKPAERDDALIIRLVERAGRNTTALLTVAGLLNRKPIPLQPYEIVSLRLDRSGAVSACNLLEEPLEREEPAPAPAARNGHSQGKEVRNGAALHKRRFALTP